jgi:hypothetical protein
LEGIERGPFLCREVKYKWFQHAGRPYLVKLLNNVHSSVDKPFECKAFNRSAEILQFPIDLLRLSLCIAAETSSTVRKFEVAGKVQSVTNSGEPKAEVGLSKEA